MPPRRRKKPSGGGGGCTANDFFVGATSGDLAKVKRGVEQGIEINSAFSSTTAKESAGLTALSLASKHGHPEVVQFLVEAGADKGARDQNGVTALMLASLFGQLAVTDYLLAQDGVEVEAAAVDGKTALILACDMGKTDCARSLVQKGAAVGARDQSGVTPLLAAAAGGHLPCAQFLVAEAGADVNAKDNDGDSPLAHSGGRGHAAVVALLLANGAETDFFLSAMCGGAEAVAAALARGQAVDAVDDDGATALMGASTKGHLEVVELLLGKGADVNLVAGPGLTALLMASSEGHLPVVQRLLAAGADPRAKFDGMSAPALATESGHEAVARCLKEAVAGRLRQELGLAATPPAPPATATVGQEST
jgi:ankyrin repeat protein